MSPCQSCIIEMSNQKTEEQPFIEESKAEWIGRNIKKWGPFVVEGVTTTGFITAGIIEKNAIFYFIGIGCGFLSFTHCYFAGRCEYKYESRTYTQIN